MLTPEEMKEKMHELSRKQGYIESIFNYCDRWCERCNFTDKCRNYAFNEDAPPPEGPQLWDYLSNVFKATKLMLEESIEKMGIDPEEIDKMISSEEPDPCNNPLYLKTHKHAVEIEEWLKNNLVGLRTSASGLDSEHQSRINEVLEIIQWYNLFIPAKISRALSGIHEDETGDIQTDSNGSAKICLIALDRSIAAWSVLMNDLHEHQDRILSILINLAEIRKQTEHVFPNARNFVRPGFDEQGLQE